MFHKGAAAELKNRMIGGTSQDVDVKRAAFDLGMPAAEARDALRALDPGHFYVYGPAFSQLEPREFITGDIQTSHPKVGQRLNVAPPKPTAAIIALLSKLADLPKEAEERAKSIDDLKRELATARRELSIAKKAQPSVTPAADPAIAKRAAASIAKLTAIIEELMKFIVTVTAKDFEGSAGVDVEGMRKAIEAAVGQSQKLVEKSMERRNQELKALQTEASRIVTRVRKLLESQDVQIDLEVRKNAPFTVAPKLPHTSLHDLATAEIAKAARPRTNGHASLSLPPGERATLTALIQFPEGLRREQLTVLTQYKRSSRDAYIQRLREKGLVETAGDTVKATDEGTAALPDAEPLPTGVDLQEHWLRKLPEGERKILQALIDAYPRTVARDALTEMTGYARSSRDAYLQRMKAKQLWTEPTRGEVLASQDLF